MTVLHIDAKVKQQINIFCLAVNKVNKHQSQGRTEKHIERNEPCDSETSLQPQLVHSSLNWKSLLQQKEAHMHMEYHENQRRNYLKFQNKEILLGPN